MVGDQLDAVAHRHPHATIHLVLGGVRRQAQQAAEGATDEILGPGHTNRGYAGGGPVDTPQPDESLVAGQVPQHVQQPRGDAPFGLRELWRGFGDGAQQRITPACVDADEGRIARRVDGIADREPLQ